MNERQLARDQANGHTAMKKSCVISSERLTRQYASRSVVQRALTWASLNNLLQDTASRF